MIIDKISNIDLYYNISPQIKIGLEYISNNDFTNIKNGKYPIIGEDVFAMVMEYNTKDISNCKLETHKKYIDIQYIVNGKELIGISSLQNEKEIEEYNSVHDIIFYENKVDSMVKIEQGMFVIFFNDDLHMPGIIYKNKELIKKVVIKVKTEEINL